MRRPRLTTYCPPLRQCPQTRGASPRYLPGAPEADPSRSSSRSRRHLGRNLAGIQRSIRRPQFRLETTYDGKPDLLAREGTPRRAPAVLSTSSLLHCCYGRRGGPRTSGGERSEMQPTHSPRSGLDPPNQDRGLMPRAASRSERPRPTNGEEDEEKSATAFLASHAVGINCGSPVAELS